MNRPGFPRRADSAFPGLVWWPRRLYETMGPGDFVAAFEELAGQDDAFAVYPIVHINPKR